LVFEEQIEQSIALTGATDEQQVGMHLLQAFLTNEPGSTVNDVQSMSAEILLGRWLLKKRRFVPVEIRPLCKKPSWVCAVLA
jgi:hypothetical protein